MQVLCLLLNCCLLRHYCGVGASGEVLPPQLQEFGAASTPSAGAGDCSSTGTHCSVPHVIAIFAQLHVRLSSSTYKLSPIEVAL